MTSNTARLWEAFLSQGKRLWHWYVWLYWSAVNNVLHYLHFFFQGMKPVHQLVALIEFEFVRPISTKSPDLYSFFHCNPKLLFWHYSLEIQILKKFHSIGKENWGKCNLSLLLFPSCNQCWHVNLTLALLKLLFDLLDSSNLSFFVLVWSIKHWKIFTNITWTAIIQNYTFPLFSFSNLIKFLQNWMFWLWC